MKGHIEATPRLDRASQNRLGRELRAMYAGLLQQPIPEHLTALIGAGKAPAEVREAPQLPAARRSPAPDVSAPLQP
jgi:hypothetical protein